MSYEGYSQVICKNGHLSSIPEDYGMNLNPKCHCGQKWAWWNHVNQTNCDDVGIIPDSVMDTFIVTPEKTETCSLGHAHIVSEAVYRIPSEEEQEKARHYSQYVNGKTVYVPLVKPAPASKHKKRKY